MAASASVSTKSASEAAPTEIPQGDATTSTTRAARSQSASSETQDFGRIDAASRIQSVIKSKQLEKTLEEQRQGDKNDAPSRWRRGGIMAERLGQQDAAPAPAVKGSSKAKTSTSGRPPSEPKSPGSPPAPPSEERSPSRVDSLAEQLRSASFVDRLPFHFKSEAEKQDFIRESRILTKRMEDQNWLEMLDPKHRYGSNLKHYHRYWSNRADTRQNFLQWLDEGEGKTLSLEECPREKLEAEKITYLTPDQRRNYMTYIDNGEDEAESKAAGTTQPRDHYSLSRSLSPSLSFHTGRSKIGTGRLRWCRTNELVKTSKYDHGDLGHGRGVALRDSHEWQAAVAAGDICDVIRDDKIKVRRRGSQSSHESFTSYDSDSSCSSASLEPDESKTMKSGLGMSDEPNHPPSSEVKEAQSRENVQDHTHHNHQKKKAPADGADQLHLVHSGLEAKADPDEKQQSRRERWLERANLGPKYLIKKKLGLYSSAERQQIVEGNASNDEDGHEQEHPDALVRRRKADTWIFVTDLSYNMYIGIKQRGRFQHSSLLAGSLVTVAGVLKVKDGIIVSIYPWSGHYRSSSQHFEEFVRRLQERGLDTSKINVTKSKMVIEVVNRYGMYRKKKDRKIKDIKDWLHDAWGASGEDQKDPSAQH